MNLLWMFTDAVIALAYAVGPWFVLMKAADAIGFEIPDWLNDGLIGILLFVAWFIYAMYLARQTTLWLGFGP